ncbi:tyrosine-type recombinase/integrase, partial [Campylobacter sp.]|uniref:tyrosine-type recombinase/integrase n=1 Tax=Campylobacter sp. TaxID=205 RepID=UPI002AA6C528
NSSNRLYLFCYASGKKVFYFKTKDRKTIKIGNLGLISLKEANYKASELHKRESNGECLVIKQEKIKPLALNEIFDTCFDEAYPLPENKESQDYDRAFRRKRDAKKHIVKWVLNKVGSMEFPKLDKQSLINAFLSENEQPSKDIMRKNLSVLKNILVVAKRKQLIEHYDFLELVKKELNEVLVDKKPIHHKGLISDDFELDEKAISALIKAVLGSNTSLMAKLLFSFMLVSPQRQGDLRSLRCENINLEKGFISFNENNNKTGAKARIPLSTQGARILNLAKKISAGKYIFSMSYKPISENTLNKLIKEQGIDFTMHSWRTTFGTAIQACDELGHNSIYRKKIADIVMLHVTQSSVDMAYFMEAAKQSEILEVLQFWGDKIESLGLDIYYLEKECSVF